MHECTGHSSDRDTSDRSDVTQHFAWRADCWAVAKRVYRFLENERFNHHHLYKGLYRIAQKTVQAEDPAYVVVALDPVNFEKPYTKKLEGVALYHSTPPHLNGEARLTNGYPAITAP